MQFVQLKKIHVLGKGGFLTVSSKIKPYCLVMIQFVAGRYLKIPDHISSRGLPTGY